VSGSDFTFNVAKGKVAYYTGLPAANDALIAILLKSSGLETDSTLKDYDDLASLLAGTSDEATDASYSRKTLTSVTVTVTTRTSVSTSTVQTSPGLRSPAPRSRSW
jgi:hypothetical protein